MIQIKLFESEEFGNIRTATIDGVPWFVGADVAIALGYINPRDALAKHVDAEDRGVAKCDTLGGIQTLSIINESGTYSLIMSSKLPSAKRFKRWVTSEVRPALRKGAGLEAIEALKMLSRENQKRGNAALYAAIPDIDRATY